MTENTCAPPGPATGGLLPCPFCGSAPVLDGVGYYHKGEETKYIQCENAGCRVKPSISQDQDEYGNWNIFEEWNTRHSPCPTPAEMAERERLLRALARFFLEAKPTTIMRVSAMSNGLIELDEARYELVFSPLGRAALAAAKEADDGR